MLSAVIPSERSQPAVLLVEQLAHQRFVRPGPLVLGTALLKSPARAADRDRHICYHNVESSLLDVGARTFLPGSACRHAGRTISSPTSLVGVRHMVSEDSGQIVRPFLLIDRTRNIVTALVVRRERVARDTRRFQHIAEFIDSALCPLSHDVLN